MGLKMKPWTLVVVLGSLIVVVAVLASRVAPEASGQGTIVRVVSPGTASVGATVAVEINIDNVTDLGAYEWVLAYNPAVLDLVNPPGNPPNWALLNGDFLESSGRSAFCPPSAILDVGTVRFGCGTIGTQQGASGSGLLSTVSFKALASGSSSLCLRWAALADPNGDDIPTGVAHDSIGIGGSPPPPSCAQAATPTPVTPPPDYTPPSGETPVPPGATATPGPPAATATPGPPAATATPPGPTPTPAPTPPPESAEVMDLIAGCNPLATTYPDGTTVQTLTGATAPAGTLTAIWKFEAGVWRAYSPEFPQVSDLAVTAFLDVVFLCVDSPGTFVRPLV
jgi:hypothetical protein